MRYAVSPLSRRTPAATPPRLLRPATTGAFAILAAACAAPGAATAQSAGGIALAPTAESQAKSIVVRKITCLKGCASIDAAKAGSTLRFQGPMMKRGKRVVYLGGPGPEDDVLAKLQVAKRGGGQLASATLPKRAHSGPVAIEVATGVRSAESADEITLPGEAVRIADVAPLTGPGPFFPIRGSYRFGTGTAAFGGGRDHKGQDVFAKCGTPLVAAEAGVVTAKTFHARAGNYVVIDVDGGVHDAMYAHLKAPALPAVGDRLEAGASIGEVGDTGRADGCHLHFELWKGNWQGVGGAGSPVDPLPTLKAWAAGPAVPASR